MVSAAAVNLCAVVEVKHKQKVTSLKYQFDLRGVDGPCVSQQFRPRDSPELSIPGSNESCHACSIPSHISYVHPNHVLHAPSHGMTILGKQYALFCVFLSIYCGSTRIISFTTRTAQSTHEQQNALSAHRSCRTYSPLNLSANTTTSRDELRWQSSNEPKTLWVWKSSKSQVSCRTLYTGCATGQVVDCCPLLSSTAATLGA